MSQKPPFVERLSQCARIVNDDQNTIRLPDVLDRVVDKAGENASPRTLTEEELAAVTLLEHAFENSGIAPRYYSTFVQRLRDGKEAGADLLLRWHNLHEPGRRRNKIPNFGAPASER